MSKYSDVFRSVSDLLSKGFKFGYNVDVKTKADNNVAFGGSAKLDSGKNASLTLKGAYVDREGNFAVDKLEVSSDKVTTGEFSLNNALPNTKATFKASERPNEGKASGVFGLTYAEEWGTLTAESDVLNGPTLNATGLFNVDGFFFGGAVATNTNMFPIKKTEKTDGGFELKDYSLAAGYRSASYSAGVELGKKLADLRVGYYQKASSTVEVGGEALWSNISAKQSSNIGLKLGVSYQIDGDSCMTATATSDNVVGLSYQHQLNKHAKLTTATQIKTNDLAGPDHKFGVSLDFNL